MHASTRRVKLLRRRNAVLACGSRFRGFYFGFLAFFPREVLQDAYELQVTLKGHTSTCEREALERARCDHKPVVMDTSALELVGSSHAVCNACDGTRMLELTKSQNVYGL